MRHGKRNELLPVLGPGQAASNVETFVEGSSGQGSKQAEDRQTRWPGAYLLEGALSRPHRVVIHAEDE